MRPNKKAILLVTLVIIPLITVFYSRSQHEYILASDAAWVVGQEQDLRIWSIIKALNSESIPLYYVLEKGQFSIYAGIDNGDLFANITFFLKSAPENGYSLRIAGLDTCQRAYSMGVLEINGEIYSSATGMAISPSVLRTSHCTNQEYEAIRERPQSLNLEILDQNNQIFDQIKFDYRVLHNGWYVAAPKVF